MGKRRFRRGEESTQGSHIRAEEEIKRIYWAGWTSRAISEEKEKVSLAKDWERSNEEEIRADIEAWGVEIK